MKSLKSLLCFLSTLQQLKEDYLNCCLARGYRYTAISFQLNDVIAFTALKEYDVIRQITDLREYAEYDYKQEVKLSSMVCPYEGFKSMGVKTIKTQEMCKL